MDPARQLLQALERPLGVDLSFVQRGLGKVAIPPQLVSRQAEPCEYSHQLLLNAVMEVALQAAPPGVLRLNQTRA